MVRSLAISEDGEYIIVGTGQNWEVSGDNTVYLLYRNGSLLWSYPVAVEVGSVAISDNGDYIVAGSEDTDIYLFDKQGTKLWNYNTSNEICSVDISGDGFYITAGGKSDYIYLFNKTSGEPMLAHAAIGDVRSVAISQDGQFHTAGDGGGNAYLFNSTNSTPQWVEDVGGYYFDVDISGNGDYIIAGRNEDLFLLNQTGQVWHYDQVGFGVYTRISLDGELIAVGSSDDVYLFSKDNNSYLWKATLPNSDQVGAVGFSSDGQYIVAGAIPNLGDSVVYVFNKTSSTTLWTALRYAQTSSHAAAGHVAISGNGSSIIAGGSYVTDYSSDGYGILYFFDLVHEPSSQDSGDLSSLVLLGFGASSGDILWIIVVLGLVSGVIVGVLLVDYFKTNRILGKGRG